MKTLIIALFLIAPAVGFSQAKQYIDSLRVTDSILQRYQKVSDTIAGYQQLRSYYAEMAYPNPLETGVKRRVDSARAIFRKRVPNVK